MQSQSARFSSRGAYWVTAIVLLTLYIPIVVMALYSFIDVSISTGEAHLTLDWYRKALTDEGVLAALRTSLWVGFWSTLGATLLGTAAALALRQRPNLEKKKSKALAFAEQLIYVPLVMPEIVMGLSLLIWFVSIGISLGPLCVILAHITFSLSYVIITVQARLEDMDPLLEEAAHDLGAGPWQTFFYIVFPLIRPGVLAGGLIAFTLSFDDFLITFFTSGVGSDTLPVRIYSMIKFGISPEIHALSTMMIAATFALVILLFRRNAAV